jgi:RimJ/RimL family protein N-acetyltransferase
MMTHETPQAYPQTIEIDPANDRSAAVAKRWGMRDLGSVEHDELGLQLRLYALSARPTTSGD